MALQVIPAPRDRVQDHGGQPGHDPGELVRPASFEHEVVRAFVHEHEQCVGREGSDAVGQEQHDPPRLLIRPGRQDCLQRNKGRDQEGTPGVESELPADLRVASQDRARPIGVRLTGRRPGEVDTRRGHRCPRSGTYYTHRRCCI
jgi:hypothetical protein